MTTQRVEAGRDQHSLQLVVECVGISAHETSMSVCRALCRPRVCPSLPRQKASESNHHRLRQRAVRRGSRLVDGGGGQAVRLCGPHRLRRSR
jgi:hypothetical protein